MATDISVIVPTFRRPALLVEAVRSALAQEGVDLEVLVFDDSSEGSARESILALGDPRVAYHKREVPSGGNPALVRQEAWPKAKGRYLTFLDDDDRVAPGGYGALAAALDADPGVALVFGRVEPFGADGAQMAHEMAFFLDAAHRARRAIWSRSRMYLVSELLFGTSLFTTSAAMVRREMLEKLGGLDPATDMIESIDLAARAGRAYRCSFVDSVVAQHRIDPLSLMHDPANADRLRDSYRHMHRAYRRRQGVLDFYALKLFARTIKRLL